MDRERVRSLAAAAVAIVIAVVPAAGRQVARAGGVPVRHAAAGGPVPGLAGSGAVLSTLPGVSAASPDDAWAVGYQALAPGGPTDTVTEHWNGRSWTQIRSPDPGTSDNVLTGVSAASRTAAWAVGGYEAGTTGRFKTLILRWNGRTWSKAASPDPGAAVSFLQGITTISRTAAWAVGYYQRSLSSPLRTLILRWNGKTWARTTSPDPSRGSDFLDEVTALSARSAWAAGSACAARCHGQAGPLGTLILHWNGRAWTRVKSPGTSGASNILDGVAATSRTSAWATGYSCTGNNSCTARLHSRRALILHWNGRAWSRITAPDPGQLTELGGITATSPRSAWAVGDYCATIRHCTNFDRLQTLIIHWNGRKWSQVTSPDPGPASSLADVTAPSPASALATGYYCTTATCSHERPLIAHWNHNRWSP